MADGEAEHEPASEMGMITTTPELAGTADAPPAYRRVMSRLMAEGRWWGEIEGVRDQMMSDAKKRFKSKDACREWVYGELDRMYPPPLNDTLAQAGASPPGKAADSGRPPDDGSIQGLGDIPAAWPELPANASLAAEVGWVQANRLRVVEERPGKATVVNLGQALSPAPSWAALGWLETSIRSYAKYVDVAARATSSDDGDATVVRRERASIEDVRTLLAEMDDVSPTAPTT